METITFSFYNSYTKAPLGGGTIKYDPFKAQRGSYSSLWRKFRVLLANTHGLDKHWVRVKVTRGSDPVQFSVALPGNRFFAMDEHGMKALLGIADAARNMTLQALHSQ